MASFSMLSTLLLIGVSGAFLSGLLGLGGAIILVPMLLYVPPLIGVGALDMKEVAGITIIVVFASSLAGLSVQNKNRLVLKNLVVLMGVCAVFAAFFGAVYSKHTSSKVLLVIFACMAAFAAVVMVLPKKESDEDIVLEEIKFSKPKAALISSGIGFIGGMVGAPGAYIFTPLMIYFLKIPTKVAIGSTLGIAFVASISGAVGKLITGQVPYIMTAAVVIGAVPAARFGARFTKKIPAAVLRKALAVVIAFAAIRMWMDVTNY
ncbi:sulfite exporter TauE/SafE family protein [Candidatus Magnetominusculus xianensis]|uniref:Probable membrane transporter protein n=1 Tax=Candidatus Magnetominusculus xianensis TaxID=1748249 RepID=A0ABR5SCE9_9BACT|nr:sulfite exporter TauE/SafE family protein [Candidatus Magnetominusculus xianensis]KWT79602.1 membrane protein [Candidatus Magnetominusculus xianensis]MBF0403815.1 sulfite exporter TauE/SafE family protein [Nitrospirota bacterium]